MSFIHQRIQHERKLSDLTQDDIAYLSDTKENTHFSKVESANKPIDMETMIIYHFLFDIPFIEFCKEKREQLKQAFLLKAPKLLKEIQVSESNGRNMRRKNHIVTLLKRYEPAYEG